MLFKNALMKVKKSYGRFISLIIIIAVGVGFFAGIRASSPDINNSVDKYYDTNNFMDFKIVSSMGLTIDDVNALKQLKNTDKVVPSYSLDVLSNGKAIKVHALEDNINTPTLVAGKMPTKANECLADSKNYKVGDTITISNDVSEQLTNKEYKVVGTVNSVLYLFQDYGISNIGDGKLSSYIFVPKDNFKLDYYTEIYLTVKNSKNTQIYSKEYDKLINQFEKDLSTLKGDREIIRYTSILDLGNNKIADAEATLKSEKSKGALELAKAKSTLDNNSKTLEAARYNLLLNEQKLNNTITTKTAEFQNAQLAINNARTDIETNLGSMGITIDQLDSKVTELSTNIESLGFQLSSLDPSSPEYTELNNTITGYETMYQSLTTIQGTLATLDAQETALNTGIAQFNTETAKAKAAIASGKQTIETNEEKLAEGYRVYNYNLNKFNTEISNAEKKIADAKSKLNGIEKPKWYIFNRTTAPGYVALKDDTQKVSLMAQILPIFFMLIVALMSLNTMTRMIDEERGEIGTLTSLGFSNRSIHSMYLLYVGTASIIGILGGFLIGSSLIPYIIYSCYKSSYILPKLIISYDLLTLALITIVTLALMFFVTIRAANKELKEKPANLLRPVPLKKGQTILLEKIGFIWKRLSFSWKVTMRNIFRYKKRVFMTIVGIAGCTALLLTGFGIRDSVSGIAKLQYSKVMKYDDLLILKNETTIINNDMKILLDKEQIQNPTLIKQASYTAKAKNNDVDINLVVPENEKSFDNYFILKSTITGKVAKLKDTGVVITQKLADRTGAGIGDTITIKNADNEAFKLKVTDVVQNYIMHYVYMSKESYSKVFGDSAKFNIVVSDHNAKSESKLAEDLMGSNLFSNVSFTTDGLNTFNQLVASLNNVIVMIIVIASILALIVLFNLTSINISERKREIATLKVLGFYDNEVNKYIYRETIILTFLSIALGLVGGVFLHRLVIGIIEADSTVFLKNISPLSYLWAFLITVFFTVIMQVFTYFKLKKINMIDSLKSVD